jgi:hypothetical protein
MRRKDVLAAYKSTFELLDADNNNEISSEELFKAMNLAGLKMSKTDAQKMVHSADQDEDQLISYHEFISIMDSAAKTKSTKTWQSAYKKFITEQFENPESELSDVEEASSSEEEEEEELDRKRKKKGRSKSKGRRTSSTTVKSNQGTINIDNSTNIDNSVDKSINVTNTYINVVKVPEAKRVKAVPILEPFNHTSTGNRLLMEAIMGDYCPMDWLNQVKFTSSNQMYCPYYHASANYQVNWSGKTPFYVGEGKNKQKHYTPQSGTMAGTRSSTTSANSKCPPHTSIISTESGQFLTKVSDLNDKGWVVFDENVTEQKALNELKSTIVANKYYSVNSQLPSDVESVTVSNVYNYAATCNLWFHPLVLLNFEHKETNILNILNGGKNGINAKRSYFLYSPESNTNNSYVSTQVGTKEKQKYESSKSTLNKRWLLIWVCMAAGIVVWYMQEDKSSRAVSFWSASRRSEDKTDTCLFAGAGSIIVCLIAWWWQTNSSYAVEVEAPRKKRIAQLQDFLGAGFSYKELGSEEADKWLDNH